MKPQVKLVLTYPWTYPGRDDMLYAVHETINTVEWTPSTRLTRADVESIIARGNVMVVTRGRSAKES